MFVYAGVGADPRNRRFLSVTQGERYDPDGEYIAQWVPEVAMLPPSRRHRPWEALASCQGGPSGTMGSDTVQESYQSTQSKSCGETMELHTSFACENGDAMAPSALMQVEGKAAQILMLSKDSEKDSSLRHQHEKDAERSPLEHAKIRATYPLPMVDPHLQIGKPRKM